jgi:DNA primase
MKVQNVDFGEALRSLAERSGVTLPQRGPASDEEDGQKARLYEVNAAAAQYFNHLLLRSEAARGARDYLARRSIAPETVESFQLGYAPDSWDALTRFLAERGYSAAELAAAGLVVEREDGRRYDRFRGRLTFPVRDQRGRVCGFGARALGDEQPKYLNTPQTAIFDKGGSLYAIDLARGAIREADRAVVVEGYVDALISHQSGVRCVVACLGTAITERQVAILKRLTKHLVLALDPDTAGDEATLRGLEVVKEVFDKKAVPVPTWRGLMRFERKLDADIRIVTLPRGKDPDELIREDSAAWRGLIDGAQPVVDYYLAALLAKADLSSAKEKEAVVERLLPVLVELGDDVQREHYIQQLARQLRLSERTLAARLARVATRPAARPVAPEVPKGRRERSLDEYLLSLFLRYPATRDRLWEVDPTEITHAASRALLVALQGGQATRDSALEALRDGLEPALDDFLAQLLRTAEAEPLLEAADVEREVAECLAEIRRRNLRAAIDELAHLLREAEEDGDAEARRRFIAQHEQLLAELGQYEHNNLRARLWRR